MAGVRALRPPAVSGIGPGLVASAMVAATAILLADRYSGPVMLFALLLGLAMNFLSQVEQCQPGIAFASRTVLRIGVALLGLRITLWQVAALGWRPVVLVIAAVSLTIAISIAIARRMGFRTDFGMLTGGATAICGASAAMALSAALPPHPHKERDTLFTIIGVSTLSTLAMLLYPALSRLLALDNVHAGIFIGGTIHEVAQVVGAGFAISPETGDTATVVKLMRVCMLLPVILAAGLLSRRSGDTEGERPPLMPWFVSAFILIVIVNSVVPVPGAIRKAGDLASRGCLITAIAALGIKTRFAELAVVGLKPIILMVVETLIIAVLVLAAIGWGLV